MKPPSLHSRVAYALRRLGWSGWLGLLLAAAGIGYGLLVSIPEQQRLAQVQSSIESDRQRLAAAPTLKNGASPGQKLATFYGGFPKGGSIADELDRIFKAAAARKVDLDVGEYSLAHSQEGRLEQYRIIFPVRGSYPDIRAFVASTLAAAPSLALESMTLRREKVIDSVVDGRLVFVLFLERES
jgi:hypothetical protein